jgi:hypothetical protein
MTFRLGILLAGCLCLLPPPVNAEHLEEVLEQMIDAYGGEANVVKLDSMVQEWDFVALTGNKHGSDVRAVAMPDQLKVELTYPDKKETRVLNGKAGFVIYDNRPVAKAAEHQADAMRLQLMRLYSPLALQRRIENIHLSDKGDFIVLTLMENGLQADYLVNKTDWHIEKVLGTLHINGMRMNFLTEYADFREVDGVIMHHKENKFAGNVNTARLELRRVELAAEIDESTFAPGNSDDEGSGETTDAGATEALIST